MECGRDSEGAWSFFWGREDQRTCMEESTFELSLERGGHLGNAEEGKGRWALQADLTT